MFEAHIDYYSPSLTIIIDPFLRQGWNISPAEWTDNSPIAGWNSELLYPSMCTGFCPSCMQPLDTRMAGSTTELPDNFGPRTTRIDFKGFVASSFQRQHLVPSFESILHSETCSLRTTQDSATMTGAARLQAVEECMQPSPQRKNRYWNVDGTPYLRSPLWFTTGQCETVCLLSSKSNCFTNGMFIGCLDYLGLGTFLQPFFSCKQMVKKNKNG